MASPSTAVRRHHVNSPFAAVEVASEVHEALESLRALITSDPGLAAGPHSTIRAEVRPTLSPAGKVELGRCYWSVQRPDPASAIGFTARTLFWDHRTGVARIVDFPDDPAMHWLLAPAGPLSSHGEQARLRVLRYIPLRRVTVSVEHAPGLPARVIAKTKKHASLVRSARALLTARHAAERADVRTFRLPEPIRLDLPSRLLYVAELPGHSLEELLAATQIDHAAALDRLGRVHRDIHELDSSCLRARTNGGWLASATAAAKQIAALAPSADGHLRALVDQLRKTIPDDADTAFCHGDFAPSQILCDPNGWSVLDFDDAIRADPHAEVAELYVALGCELPHPTSTAVHAARRAYLAGYLERAGQPLDPTRWSWFIAVAQLRYLARRIVKGRAAHDEIGTVLEALRTEPIEPPDVHLAEGYGPSHHDEDPIRAGSWR